MEAAAAAAEEEEAVDGARGLPRTSSPLKLCVLSVRASGEPNHSFALVLGPPYEPVLVHRDSPRPVDLPPPPSSLEMLAPLRDSREEGRKRLIVPRVRMSSVEMLNPPEGGMGEDERRRKGLSNFLGFAAHPPPLAFFAVETEGEQVGVRFCSYGSGRVTMDVLRLTSQGRLALSRPGLWRAFEAAVGGEESEEGKLPPAAVAAAVSDAESRLLVISPATTRVGRFSSP